MCNLNRTLTSHPTPPFPTPTPTPLSVARIVWQRRRVSSVCMCNLNRMTSEPSESRHCAEVVHLQNIHVFLDVFLGGKNSASTNLIFFHILDMCILIICNCSLWLALHPYLTSSSRGLHRNSTPVCTCSLLPHVQIVFQKLLDMSQCKWTAISWLCSTGQMHNPIEA